METLFRKHAKGRMGHNGQNKYTSLKLNVINKLKQKISIPINKDGSFNIEAQREMANKYKKIDDVKKNICLMLEKLIATGVKLA